MYPLFRAYIRQLQPQASHCNVSWMVARIWPGDICCWRSFENPSGTPFSTNVKNTCKKYNFPRKITLREPPRWGPMGWDPWGSMGTMGTTLGPMGTRQLHLGGVGDPIWPADNGIDVSTQKAGDTLFCFRVSSFRKGCSTRIFNTFSKQISLGQIRGIIQETLQCEAWGCSCLI